MNADSRILLVDNGSLEPASTQQLRRLAAGLTERVRVEVVPASVAHSSKIPAEQLDGRPAELFEAALDRVLREGAIDVRVVPLFVGPSYAIVRHVPAVIAEQQTRFPQVRIALADPLAVAGEPRLAQILAAHVREILTSTAMNGEAGARGGTKVRVAVVDHGSPSRAVTDVRDAVAAQARDLLGDEVAAVTACSMERRDGPEYAFNEPLLANLLREDGWRDGPVVVALLFIAPGKHAGDEGDVAQIVRRARPDGGAGVRFTPVLGAHPLLLEVLADRARDVRCSRLEPTAVAGAVGTL
ncbi:sirohydrochlorin chelatase [Opitutus terrae]|uniref:Cobalamin (Vitamin B12) biosynthesis CbiX protein n=1 Tax=Opitutus terrae (strain DSM 11246 / JCM 15787 / PB90-1) TaxID=452637 RepID=B1ZSB7_OPITP|nr:CbiX/SirB N-terminal domain-containing protein [Opitutus terrae]ACB75716.1 cobalamin (vitamin B12) biosynthesis CbiX protein [Opitutus terrae PB90-1]